MHAQKQRWWESRPKETKTASTSQKETSITTNDGNEKKAAAAAARHTQSDPNLNNRASKPIFFLPP